jgi:gluconokinase
VPATVPLAAAFAAAVPPVEEDAVEEDAVEEDAAEEDLAAVDSCLVIVIVAGVSGSGKTTVGAMLVGRLGWRFADADDFHPAANIEKMRAGVPLTDQDRWPWLRAIAAWMDERIARGEQAVITCSALKRSYRDMLLAGRPEARMVFLAVDRQVLARRLAARHGHFFPEQLLSTQLDDLEPPRPDERVISVVPAGDPVETVASIIAVLWPEEKGPGEKGPGDPAGR